MSTISGVVQRFAKLQNMNSSDGMKVVRTVEREQGELGFKGWAETEALFPSEGKGHDDDDHDE